MTEKMIHVRFASDGSVREIGERPGSLSPQEWFDLLCQEGGAHYQGLSGGRGLFRIPEALWESIEVQIKEGRASP